MCRGLYTAGGLLVSFGEFNRNRDPAELVRSTPRGYARGQSLQWACGVKEACRVHGGAARGNYAAPRPEEEEEEEKKRGSLRHVSMSVKLPLIPQAIVNNFSFV